MTGYNLRNAAQDLGRNLGQTALGFRRDVRGNMAMMMAASLGVITIAVGAAVDYSRASSRSNDLQNIVDSAVLAGAASKDKTDAEVKAQVEAVIAQYNTQGWDLEVHVVVDKDRVTARIGNKPDTTFGAMLGRSDVPIMVDSASPRAQDTPVHLSLVLDTTDSMEGANLAAMQSAAVGLIDTLEDFPTGTRVSIVPFGSYVNIGNHTRPRRNWLDTGKMGETVEHCYPEQIEVVAPVCKKKRKTRRRKRDGLDMGVESYDSNSCEGGEWRDGPEVCTTRTIAWNGCMGSRMDGFAEIANYRGRKYPAALDRSCGTEMMGLSQDFNAMRDMINGLSTSGSTYIPSGLSWGWRSLTPNQPYTEARNTSAVRLNRGQAAQNNVVNVGQGGEPRLSRAMLFMTDGLNTKNIGGTDPSGNTTLHDGSDGDQGLRMADTVCENIKADDIEIFVVAYRVPGQTETVTTLENCASSASHFFTPDSAAQLKSTFEDVASMLDSTRLEF